MSAEDNLSVYDIKLEIARRIEIMTSEHGNQGAIQGLDSLWKWIQQSTQEDEG